VHGCTPCPQFNWCVTGVFMFLQDKSTGNLIEIVNLEKLIDPSESHVPERSQSGEEEQEPEPFGKEGLIFPSGEELPRCWIDRDYKSA
jgi:hypothetical protein